MLDNSPPPGPDPSTRSPSRHQQRDRWLAAALAAALAGATTFAIGVDAARPRPDGTVITTAADLPCTHIIDGIPIYLDPCVPDGDPLPDDIPPWIDEIQHIMECTGAQLQPPDESPTPEQTAAVAATVIGPSETTDPTPTIVPSGPFSPTPTVSGFSSPPVTPTDSPTAAPSASPTPCPTPTGSPPPSSTVPPSPVPSVSPTEPTPSPTPSTISPSPSPSESPEPCTSASAPQPPTAAAIDEDPPKDKEADRLCRKPADSAKDTVLVATGDSVTSAYQQAKSVASLNCTINGSTKDHRGLWGNDMLFSYAGKYYTTINKNISEYYNFARIGFTTDDIRKIAAAGTDTCKNPWNRVKPPLDLAVDAVKAAKTDKKQAYFVTTGGINNTNWTDILAQFAKCRGLQILADAFKATVFSTNDTKFEWWAKGELPGKIDNIMAKGGGCRATFYVNRWPLPPLILDPIRIAVPAYDGPGSGANESALSKQIPDDAKAIVDAIVTAGADKIAWMLYYDINWAEIDMAAVAKDILGGIRAIKYIKGVVPAIFNLGAASLVPPELVGKAATYQKAMNDAIKSKIPANPKVTVVTAPVLRAGDIQQTTPMGCPHPNDSGHTKLANALKGAFGG